MGQNPIPEISQQQQFSYTEISKKLRLKSVERPCKTLGHIPKSLGDLRGRRWVEGIDDTLKNHATQLNLDLNSSVWEWANDTEGWNKEKLKSYLPNNITARLLAQPPPNSNNGKDRQGWRLSEDGDYSVAATYRALANWPPPSTTNWSKLWQ
ncbi:hypothetical protein Ahy_A03g014386 [Arachis hypogaea]|uniref:Uncharacterized protein n=1 Tax=Arachis hypogaea TaxID=3818 RepID=A0A445DXW8_ARAHY|nr:hypothetical protein Ahy_A03g014386 [Arachis hypogaea]